MASTTKIASGGTATSKNRHSSTKTAARSRRVSGRPKATRVPSAAPKTWPMKMARIGPTITVVDDQHSEQGDRCVDHPVHSDLQPTDPHLLPNRHDSTRRSGLSVGKRAEGDGLAHSQAPPVGLVGAAADQHFSQNEACRQTTRS